MLQPLANGCIHTSSLSDRISTQLSSMTFTTVEGASTTNSISHPQLKTIRKENQYSLIFGSGAAINVLLQEIAPIGHQRPQNRHRHFNNSSPHQTPYYLQKIYATHQSAFRPLRLPSEGRTTDEIDAFNPFTPKSDRFRISPLASPVIL